MNNALVYKQVLMPDLKDTKDLCVRYEAEDEFVVKVEANELKMMRTIVNSILEHIALITETIDQFDSAQYIM